MISDTPEQLSNSLESSLETNARFLALLLLLSAVVGSLIAAGVAWQTDLSFIYYFSAFFAACGVGYTIAYFLIRTGRRVAGIGLAQLVFISAFTSIVFGFRDVGLIISFIIGVVIWQISYLTLESKQARRATVVGVVFAIATIVVELYSPFQRLRVEGAIWGTYIIGGSLAAVFIILFLRNFRNFNIQTKLIVTTITIALLSTIAALILLTSSTRTVLTNQTEVEIELRGQQIASEVSTQLERQIDRLRALSTNQDIVDQISADISDLENLETPIVNLILSRRNEVWINEESNPALTVGRHFAFFSRLRNPVADLLRDYRQNFPETEQLLIINQYGSVVAMSNRSDAPQYLFDESEWWQKIIANRQNEPYVGNPVTLPDGSLGIPIAVPIQDANNNLVGIIYSVYSTNQLILSLGLDDSQAAETNFSLIIDTNSFLPLRPAQNTTEPPPINNAEIADLMGMRFSQIRSTTGDNLVTAIPMSSSFNGSNIFPSEWGIFVSRPLENLESIIAQQQRVQILIGLGIVAAAAFLAGLLARAISAPIISLANIAKRLESGELSARTNISSRDEVGSLGLAFNQMAEQSQRLVSQLETRVAERTQALETSFRVSQTISSITEKQELVSAVVNQLQAAFDYYHVHIYLVNEENENLDLVAGSGEPGRRLLEIKHSLAMGQGLVGRTAISKMPVIVPDVSQDLQWIPNRFLPDTKSELAVPILLEQEVLGVIDVQDDKVNTLTEREAGFLRSIADQVAVALRNAEQIQRERERADREEKINAIREKIFRTQDIESAMKTAVKEIGIALGKKSTIIQLKDDSKEDDVAADSVAELSEAEKAKLTDLTPEQHTQKSSQSKNGLNGHHGK